MRALQSQRSAQVAEALALIQSGHRIQEACVQVGISYDQFKYWIAKSSDGIEAIRRLGIELQRRQMLMIASSQEEILADIINDAKSESIEVKDRLAILKYLDDRYERLSDEHGSTGAGEDAAKEYLQGPIQKKGQSRLRGQTINVSPRNDGSVDITTYSDPVIIDIKSDDDEES